MTRFEFGNPDGFADDENASVVGVGAAADGRIRAVIGAQGRLSNLDIAPELLRHNSRGGTLLDSTTLAAEITNAVNAAIDGYARRATAPDTAAITAQLTQVSETFQRAINDVTAELERTERRLDSR